LLIDPRQTSAKGIVMHRFVFLVFLVVSAAPATALAAQETSENKAAQADRSKHINRGDTGKRGWLRNSSPRGKQSNQER